MKRRRISSKIMILIIACSLFTACLIGSFSLYQGTKYIKIEANDKLIYMARSYANEFSQTFERAETYVDSLRSAVIATFDMNAFRNDPDYIDKFCKEFNVIMDKYISQKNDALEVYITFNFTEKFYLIWYVDTSGNGVLKQVEVNHTYSSSEAIHDWEGINYIFATTKREEPLWVGPYKDFRFEDLTPISYVAPIIIDGTVIGVAGMDIDFEDIEKTIEEMDVYQSGYAFLMSENHEILVNPDYTQEINLKGIKDGKLSPLVNQTFKNPYGILSYKVQGKKEILGYCKLSNGWILVLAPPYQEIFKPAWSFSIFIAILTLAGIAISVLLAYFFSKKVSKTMDCAAKQLRYIEIGDFKQEIPKELLESNDDLGCFIKSVYTLQNVIKDLMKTIETKGSGTFFHSFLINNAVERTQHAALEAAIAIEQISLDRVEKEVNLKETLVKLEEFNTKLQTIVKEEVESNRRKDAVVIYQSRFAKMGEMIGNIAHQWRQPLNSLTTILSELKDSIDYGDINQEHFKSSIEKSKQIIVKMSQTIDDFRDFLSPSKEKAPFSIYQAVLFSLDIMEQGIHSNNIQVKTNLVSDAFVFGYENEFSQVISNILNNAKDALEESSKLKKVIAIEIMNNNHFAEIKIFNNGHQIPPEVLSKIFIPYFTTKTLGKGTGIGLYMSKIIIEEHMSGKISLENVKNGVCCSISLPVYDELQIIEALHNKDEGHYGI